MNWWVLFTCSPPLCVLFYLIHCIRQDVIPDRAWGALERDTGPSQAQLVEWHDRFDDACNEDGDYVRAIQVADECLKQAVEKTKVIKSERQLLMSSMYGANRATPNRVSNPLNNINQARRTPTNRGAAKVYNLNESEEIHCSSDGWVTLKYGNYHMKMPDKEWQRQGMPSPRDALAAAFATGRAW